MLACNRRVSCASHCVHRADDLLVDGQKLVRVHGDKNRAGKGVDLLALVADAEILVDAVDIDVGDAGHVGHTVLGALT